MIQIIVTDISALIVPKELREINPNSCAPECQGIQRPEAEQVRGILCSSTFSIPPCLHLRESGWYFSSKK